MSLSLHNRWTIVSVGGAVIAASLVITGLPVSAPPMYGEVRAGLNVDADALTIGGGVLLDLERSGGWSFNPNLEIGLDEADDPISMNGDFHFDFPGTPRTSLYLGAGLAVLSRDRESNFGLNLVAGLAGKHGRVRPYGQFKGVMGETDAVLLMGGVRF